VETEKIKILDHRKVVTKRKIIRDAVTKKSPIDFKKGLS